MKQVACIKDDLEKLQGLVPAYVLTLLEGLMLNQPDGDSLQLAEAILAGLYETGEIEIGTLEATLAITAAWHLLIPVNEQLVQPVQSEVE